MNRQSQPFHTDPARTDAPQPAPRQRGSIVVYLAVALVVFGVMAMAGASRFGASIMGVSAPNCATQARLMAESGVRFASAYLRGAADQGQLNTRLSTLNSHGPYTVASGLSFTVTAWSTGTGTVVLSATGSACGGTSFLPTAATQASTSVNIPVVIGGGGTPGEGVSFAGGDTPGFTATAIIGGSGAITIDAAGTVTLGGNLDESSGSVWYSGNKDVCANGNCTLGTGLRAYFDLVFSASALGDGFVWTLMSAESNTNASSGGDSTMGELMGYGGKGALGLGTQPPKFGVEFDIYTNSGTGSACDVGNRADTTADHLAYIFWGTESLTCGGRVQQATYDDNRHGAGNATTEQPRNSANDGGDGAGNLGYYIRPGGDNNWLQDGGLYRFRYELLRYTTPTPRGDYTYKLRSWIKKSTDTFATGLNNTDVDYAPAPELYRTLALTPALHAKMGHVFFGWTEGTGAETQLVTLTNFKLDFRGAIQWPPKDYTAGWPMDEGSGTNVHNSNATNPVAGTLGGTTLPTWVTNPDCPTCISLSFNGLGRVSVPENNSLDLTTAGAISAWIYPTALTNNTYILHKGDQADTSDEAFGLRFSTGGELELRLRYGNPANSYVIVESAALPAANTWYHVVAQWDANILAIYINGVLSNSATNTNNRAARNTGGDVIIGARHTAGAGPYLGFNGRIDDVYLYKRLLTAAEIAVLSQTSMP